MPSTRFIVSGRVQGVFYRASTREQALRLGLAGHVKNRFDGSVEVLARGEAEALDALERWLLQGPPAARVETVDREDLPEHDPSGQDLRGFHTG